jgi:hypothetical protein
MKDDKNENGIILFFPSLKTCKKSKGPNQLIKPKGLKGNTSNKREMKGIVNSILCMLNTDKAQILLRRR